MLDRPHFQSKGNSTSAPFDMNGRFSDFDLSLSLLEKTVPNILRAMLCDEKSLRYRSTPYLHPPQSLFARGRAGSSRIRVGTIVRRGHNQFPQLVPMAWIVFTLLSQCCHHDAL